MAALTGAAAIAPIGEIPCRSKPEYRENGIGAAGDITIGTIGGQQPLHQPGGGCGSVCRSDAPRPSLRRPLAKG